MTGELLDGYDGLDLNDEGVGKYSLDIDSMDPGMYYAVFKFELGSGKVGVLKPDQPEAPR